MNKHDLANLITESFTNEPHPGDLQIVYDNSGYHLEALNIREAFKRYTWQTMPPELMRREQDCLGFLSRAGFKYYFPAFMRFVVTDYHAADSIPDNLISTLTLPIEADVVVSALDIKRYRMDKDMPSIDWNDILQDRLKSLDQNVHNFIEQAALFSNDQRRVIYQFLAHMGDEYSQDFFNREPAIAIERYWFQFA